MERRPCPWEAGKKEGKRLENRSENPEESLPWKATGTRDAEASTGEKRPGNDAAQAGDSLIVFLEFFRDLRDEQLRRTHPIKQELATTRRALRDLHSLVLFREVDPSAMATVSPKDLLREEEQQLVGRLSDLHGCCDWVEKHLVRTRIVVGGTISRSVPPSPYKEPASLPWRRSQPLQAQER